MQRKKTNFLSDQIKESLKDYNSVWTQGVYLTLKKLHATVPQDLVVSMLLFKQSLKQNCKGNKYERIYRLVKYYILKI